MNVLIGLSRKLGCMGIYLTMNTRQYGSKELDSFLDVSFLGCIMDASG